MPCSPAILRKPCMRARGAEGQVRRAARWLLLPHTCAAFKCYTQRGGPCRRPLHAALNSLLRQLTPLPNPAFITGQRPACTRLHDAGIVLGVRLHVALDDIQRRHRCVGGAAGHDAAQAARHVKVLRGFGCRGAGGVGGSARQARACCRRGQRRRWRRCVITTLPAKPFCWRGWRGVWHTQCGTRGAPRAPAGPHPARGPASAP